MSDCLFRDGFHIYVETIHGEEISTKECYAG